MWYSGISVQDIAVIYLKYILQALYLPNGTAFFADTRCFHNSVPVCHSFRHVLSIKYLQTLLFGESNVQSILQVLRLCCCFNWQRIHFLWPMVLWHRLLRYIVSISKISPQPGFYWWIWLYIHHSYSSRPLLPAYSSQSYCYIRSQAI